MAIEESHSNFQALLTIKGRAWSAAYENALSALQLLHKYLPLHRSSKRFLLAPSIFDSSAAGKKEV